MEKFITRAQDLCRSSIEKIMKQCSREGAFPKNDYWDTLDTGVSFSLDFCTPTRGKLNAYLHLSQGERIKKGLMAIFYPRGQVLILIGISMIQWNKGLLPGLPEWHLL